MPAAPVASGPHQIVRHARPRSVSSSPARRFRVKVDQRRSLRELLIVGHCKDVGAPQTRRSRTGKTAAGTHAAVAHSRCLSIGRRSHSAPHDCPTRPSSRRQVPRSTRRRQPRTPREGRSTAPRAATPAWASRPWCHPVPGSAKGRRRHAQPHRKQGSPRSRVPGVRFPLRVHKYQKRLLRSKRRFRRQSVSGTDVVVDKRKPQSEFFFLGPVAPGRSGPIAAACARSSGVGWRPTPAIRDKRRPGRQRTPVRRNRTRPGRTRSPEPGPTAPCSRARSG